MLYRCADIVQLCILACRQPLHACFSPGRWRFSQSCFSLCLFVTPDYTVIVQNLNYIQGEKAAKQAFIKEIISEARKYKKLQLIALLESHLESMG